MRTTNRAREQVAIVVYETAAKHQVKGGIEATVGPLLIQYTGTSRHA